MFTDVAKFLPMMVSGYVVLGLVLLYILTVVWAWSDAISRGKSPVLTTLVVAFLVWPIGLFAWLLFRPNHRESELRLPRFKPRYGIAALLAFMTLVGASIVVFMAMAKYEAVVLARLPVTGNQASYEKQRQDVIKQVFSDSVLSGAAAKLSGKADPELASEISKRLTADYPGQSEILRIAVSGNRITHKERYKDIANAVATTLIEQNPGTMTLIQPAIVPNTWW